MTITGPATPTRVQLLTLGGASMLVPLNSTMIAVALPRIADDFDQSVGATSLLVTIYLVAMLVGQPVAGRIGDRLGRALVVRVALGVFLVSSLAAASSVSFPMLVACRFGQAVGGALLTPNVQALLRAATPAHDRGRVFGSLGSMIGIGAASGPVVAGGLIQVTDWPAIFLANVPITVLALLVALPTHGEETDPSTAREPAARTLRNPVFVASFSIQALSTLGQYLLLLLAPVVLEARGWSSGAIGLALSGLTVGMIVTGPLGGRAGDRLGRRVPVLSGEILTLVALLAATVAGEGIDPLPLVAVLLVFGVGFGFAAPSMLTAALESVAEARAGAAAGVFSMSRYVGSITSSLLVAAWISDDGGGSRPALLVATVAGGLAVLLTTRLPGRESASAR